MNQQNRRMRHLKLALLSLFAAAALLASPRLAQRVYAQDTTGCTANCKNGSCTGTGNCTCSCSFWTGTPTCSCTTEVVEPAG